MKNYVNLLPEGEQKEIRLEKLTSHLLNFFVWIFLSLVALTLVFLATRFFLRSELKMVSEQIVQQRQVVSKEENQKLKMKLDDFNTDLANYVNLEKNHAVWSDVLVSFAQLVPPDVSIDSLVADRKSRNIKIAGFAKSRESVLKLRDYLLSSDYFEQVNFPLSNLAKPTNLSFHYSFYVKADKLIPAQK